MAPPAPAQKLAELLDAAKAPENRGIVYGLAAAATAVAGLTLLYKKSQAPPKTGRFASVPLGDDEYLAVIVGAGPSGSACGYYLAREGHKVALLDKARFPRGAFFSLRFVFFLESAKNPRPSVAPSSLSPPLLLLPPAFLLVWPPAPPCAP